MQSYSYVFGIDVSKDYLDIVSLEYGQQRGSYQLLNTPGAIKSWISQCLCRQNTSLLCVLEPTGAYSAHLLELLSEWGIATKLVNPTQSAGFSKAQGIITKTDRQAAHTLALMGYVLQDLPLYKAPCKTMKKRKQLLSAVAALQKQRQALKNQLHALSHQVIYAPQVVASFEQLLDTTEAQIQTLEDELADLSEEEHHRQLRLMQSVVGIGPKTAQLLLACTGGLQHFSQAGQLAKFIGIVPTSHFSGSSVYKKGRITKRGNTALRATLYMAARSAKRFNLACKALYDRLRARGKCHRQAMVAVMHKLVKQIFGVVQSGVSFDNQHYLKFKTH